MQEEVASLGKHQELWDLEEKESEAQNTKVWVRTGAGEPGEGKNQSVEFRNFWK